MTLASLLLAGRKSLWSPAIGAMSLVPWTAACWLLEAYPMMIMNVVITGLHIRTFILWRRDKCLST